MILWGGRGAAGCRRVAEMSGRSMTVMLEALSVEEGSGGGFALSVQLPFPLFPPAGSRSNQSL